jgi:YggT family protein
MNPVTVLVQILLLLLNIYEIVLLLRVLISWFRLDPYNPIVRVLYSLTEPLLQPIRQLLPQTGMVDFSPLVALLLLFAIRNVIQIVVAGL